VRAYSETFGLPVTITNCSNNYGPSQFPEKVIPLFVTHALDDQPLPLYASTQNRREWLHVADHCRAIELVLERGEPGETYNVGSGVEKSIEDIADAVLGAHRASPRR
jgi:dTDP-glucose 4,6-dehydratase